MARLLVVLILIAVAWWIWREFSQARRQQSQREQQRVRRHVSPRPYRRVDDESLRERVSVLRAAVQRGDVTVDEAAGSLARYAGGGMTPQEARSLLDG